MLLHKGLGFMQKCLLCGPGKLSALVLAHTHGAFMALMNMHTAPRVRGDKEEKDSLFTASPFFLALSLS